MKTIVECPTQERLRELFDYDSRGVLVRKVSRPGVRVGDIAGCEGSRGYWQVMVDGRSYTLHRLIWIWHHGDIPDGRVIDHIDGDKLNNQIENLRPLSNRDNSRRETSTKRNLPRNVYRHRRGFKVEFKIDGKTRGFGSYPTVEEAVDKAEEVRATLE